MWDVRCTICIAAFRIHHMSVLPNRIRTHSRCHGNYTMTHTWNSLYFQFLMMISPISSHLSLSNPHLLHRNQRQIQVICHDFSVPWSSIHTEYRNYPRLSFSHFHQVPSFSPPSCILLSTFPRVQEYQRLETSLPSLLLYDLRPAC